MRCVRGLGRVLLLFFFFQAEDGIRDLTVTGVQTCALPISEASGAEGRGARGERRAGGAARGSATCVPGWPDGGVHQREPDRIPVRGRLPEIGRASCRERV